METSSFYYVLLKSHSGLRWIILLLLISSVVIAFSASRNGKPYAANKKIYLFTLIFVHLQMLAGIILYATSTKVALAFSDVGLAMKNTILRFTALEHAVLMLAAVLLITIGYSRSKKANGDSHRHKKIFLFYLMGLVCILVSIPWPFRGMGNGWF